MWYVYILKCNNNTLYTGATNDLERRLKQHNSGKGSKYVRAVGGAVMAYSERKRTKSTALKREAEIKKWPRAKKLTLIKKKLNP